MVAGQAPGSAEPAPIFTAHAAEGEWYRHFVAAAERVRDQAEPWPLSPVRELARVKPAGFADTFGTDLDRYTDLSQNLLITGIVRNAFVHTRYRMLENYLKSGRSVRVLLIDPTSPAMRRAVEHYNVDRSVPGARSRVENTLRILAQLHFATGGELSVRLTANPFGGGHHRHRLRAGGRRSSAGRLRPVLLLPGEQRVEIRAAPW